ncbi:0b098e37-7124-4ec1-a722-d729003e9370 [Sclerotinia trifoliorum]|uniref:0b098e37-7124-4ec1-a722-d729003e9370 n=1 Tax=Sclerotinia trifoliorum TaxID=28548 RepID=A0A8H2W768_9HELO|nr:0b098e37-7124-4ec1-a722-d729003e9370 [Sclerotinia trifoliorum]
MYFHLPFITAFLVSFASARYGSLLESIGTGPGPWQNASYFEEYNQSPNATGSGPLYSVNTSVAPPTGQIVSWDTRINVTEVPWTAKETVTNTVISFDTQDNIFPSNSSWQTCVILFTNVPRNVTVKGQNDPGDCTTLYTKECISDFNSAILFARLSAGGPCPGSLLNIIPNSCAGSIIADFSTAQIVSNQTHGSAWMSRSSDPHDSADFTFYEEAVTRIWPILIMQSPSEDFRGTGLSFSNMSCLRAKNITSGSKNVNDVPGAGSRMALGGWTLFVVMGAMSLFF